MAQAINKKSSKSNQLQQHREKKAAKKGAGGKVPAKKAAAKKEAKPAKKPTKAPAAATLTKAPEPQRIFVLSNGHQLRDYTPLVIDTPKFNGQEILRDQIPTQKELRKEVKQIESIAKVPVDQIRVREGFNRRKDFGDIEGLANSIAEMGMLKPITVDAYADGESTIFLLDDGERRFKAILHLRSQDPELMKRFEFVTAIINERTLTETDRLLIQSISNNGKTFEPLEEAELFLTLTQEPHNLKPIEVAKKTGNSIAYVEQRLLLAQASDEEKALIKEGAVSGTVVMEQMRHEGDAEVRVKNIREAKDKGTKLKVKDVKGGAKAKQTASPEASAKKSSEVVDKCDEMVALIKQADRKNDNEEVRAYLFEIEVKVRELKKLLR